MSHVILKPDDKLKLRAQQAIDALRAAKLTIVTAESCTAGSTANWYRIATPAPIVAMTSTRTSSRSGSMASAANMPAARVIIAACGPCCQPVAV